MGHLIVFSVLDILSHFSENISTYHEAEICRTCLKHFLLNKPKNSKIQTYLSGALNKQYTLDMEKQIKFEHLFNFIHTI